MVRPLAHAACLLILVGCGLPDSGDAPDPVDATAPVSSGPTPDAATPMTGHDGAGEPDSPMPDGSLTEAGASSLQDGSAPVAETSAPPNDAAPALDSMVAADSMAGLDSVAALDSTTAPDSTFAPDTAPASDATSCPCTLGAPPGWTLVAYASDRTVPCPAGFTTNELLAAPTAGAGACTCGDCQMLMAPSCSMGTFSSMAGSSSCSGQGLTHAANDGGCTVYAGGPLDNYGMAVAPQPIPGTCTAPATGDPLSVTSEEVLVCVPPADGCACGAPVSSFQTCLFQAGDQTCPPATATKVSVGAGVTVSCDDCPCALQATCSGMTTYYEDSMCGTALATITTSTCGRLSAAGQDFGSYEWQGTATPMCNIGAPPSGTPALSGVGTICCP
jgi:hypothetical protein